MKSLGKTILKNILLPVINIIELLALLSLEAVTYSKRLIKEQEQNIDIKEKTISAFDKNKLDFRLQGNPRSIFHNAQLKTQLHETVLMGFCVEVGCLVIQNAATLSELADTYENLKQGSQSLRLPLKNN